MKAQVLFAIATSLLAAGPSICQPLTKPVLIKIPDSAADRYILECTLEDAVIDIDETGNLVSYTPIKPDLLTIQFWQKGWGAEKTGKVRSIGKIAVDYWAPGWGVEKAGKVKSVGSISFDYWAESWGAQRAGKIKTINSISFDYWAAGWGAEKFGKIRSAGPIKFDYWAKGFGDEKCGRIKSVEGHSDSLSLCINYAVNSTVR